MQEWGATARGVEDMGRSTASALGSYFTARSSGLRSTKSFFSTDLSSVSTSQVARQLQEVTHLFASATVVRDASIRDFCEKYLCGSYQTGNAYYELTKPEAIQSYKKVVVENRHSGKRYSGPDGASFAGPAGWRGSACTPRGPRRLPHLRAEYVCQPEAGGGDYGVVL